DVEDAVLLARVVYRNDVGVLEQRREPRLEQEALAEVLASDRVREQLQRRGPAETEVVRTVDLARRAHADLLVKAVASDDAAGADLRRHWRAVSSIFVSSCRRAGEDSHRGRRE